VGFGRLILGKVGKLDLEFLMELLAFQQYNGYALLAKKVIIHLKDVVDFSNLYMIVYESEQEQYYNFIQTVKTNFK
jgi:hypothetical protein